MARLNMHRRKHTHAQHHEPSVQHPPCHPSNTDYGDSPFVTDIKKATLHNHAFRVALWTGSHLQLTLMAVPPGEDIGLEMHPHVDQLLCVQQGQGVVLMGEGESNLHFKQPVFDDCVMIIPAGKWHNIINTGCRPLKLYSVYAPPNHPWGTVHVNKSDEAH